METFPRLGSVRRTCVPPCCWNGATSTSLVSSPDYLTCSLGMRLYGCDFDIDDCDTDCDVIVKHQRHFDIDHETCSTLIVKHQSRSIDAHVRHPYNNFWISMSFRLRPQHKVCPLRHSITFLKCVGKARL